MSIEFFYLTRYIFFVFAYRGTVVLLFTEVLMSQGMRPQSGLWKSRVCQQQRYYVSVIGYREILQVVKIQDNRKKIFPVYGNWKKYKIGRSELVQNCRFALYKYPICFILIKICIYETVGEVPQVLLLF